LVLQVDGWSESALADVAEKKIVYGIVQAGEHDEGGMPYIKSSDVGSNIQPNNLAKTAISIHQKYHRSKVQPGDIVFSLRGNTGATSIVPTDLPEANLTQGTARISVGPDFDNRFVRYVLASDIAMRQVLAVAKGSTFTEVSLDALRKIKVPHPPLPEQRKIAEILSTWDAAIEKTEALLATAKAQKRALMQSLLTGKRRFPEFEGQPWKEVRLGDVATVDASSLGSKTPADYEFEYISLSNVQPGRVVGPLEKMAYRDAPSRARRKVKAGDLLVSTVRPNLSGFARISEQHVECIASTGFAVVSPRHDVDGSYLFHHLFSHHMAGQFHALVVGSNYPAINSTDVKKLWIKIPSVEEQRRIGAVLNDCDLEISELADSIEQLRAEKKALMQQLLTGKRRVKA
jgi:type I restriction enzyme S subunit